MPITNRNPTVEDPLAAITRANTVVITTMNTDAIRRCTKNIMNAPRILGLQQHSKLQLQQTWLDT